MPDHPRTISASEFKARCLAILDEVARSRVPMVVTKRGRPVGRLVPMDDEPPPSLLGSVRYESDDELLAPVDDEWEADQ